MPLHMLITEKSMLVTCGHIGDSFKSILNLVLIKKNAKRFIFIISYANTVKGFFLVLFLHIKKYILVKKIN